MKICPNCQNTYTDDSLQFCLQDGTRLNTADAPSQTPTAVWNDEAQTVIRKEPNQVRIDLTEPKTAPPVNHPTVAQTSARTEPSPKSKVWLFALLGLLGLFAVGGLGAAGLYFYLNPGQKTVVQNNTNQGNSNPVNQNVSNNANLTPTPTATPTPKPTLKPAEIETAKKEAENLIYGWNLKTNLSSYADTVDYYKGGKIGKSKIKANKEPAYKKYDSIAIDISNMKVTVDPTGEKATVTFDKEWDFSGVDKDGNESYTNGKVQQQIILNKFNGKWKIVSEKDLKVYYTDKSSADKTSDDEPANNDN